MNLRFLSSSLRALCIVSVLTVLAACGSKINSDNYQKIETGMTLAQVEAILGKPTDEITSEVAAAGISSAIHSWKDGNATIIVQLLDDKIISKSKVGF